MASGEAPKKTLGNRGKFAPKVAVRPTSVFPGASTAPSPATSAAAPESQSSAFKNVRPPSVASQVFVEALSSPSSAPSVPAFPAAHAPTSDSVHKHSYPESTRVSSASTLPTVDPPQDSAFNVVPQEFPINTNSPDSLINATPQHSLTNTNATSVLTPQPRKTLGIRGLFKPKTGVRQSTPITAPITVSNVQTQLTQDEELLQTQNTLIGADKHPNNNSLSITIPEPSDIAIPELPEIETFLTQATLFDPDPLSQPLDPKSVPHPRKTLGNRGIFTPKLATIRQLAAATVPDPSIIQVPASAPIRRVHFEDNSEHDDIFIQQTDNNDMEPQLSTENLLPIPTFQSTTTQPTIIQPTVIQPTVIQPTVIQPTETSTLYNEWGVPIIASSIQEQSTTTPTSTPFQTTSTTATHQLKEKINYDNYKFDVPSEKISTVPLYVLINSSFISGKRSRRAFEEEERKMREGSTKRRSREDSVSSRNGVGSRVSGNTSSELFQRDHTPQPTQVIAPRIIVDENGMVRMDQSSLVVEEDVVVGEVNGRDEADLLNVDEDATRYITSSSFCKRRTRGKRWTPEQTDLFFNALSWYGTDFSMISLLFPGMTSTNIRLKFKAEDRKSTSNITRYLNNRAIPPADIEELMTKEQLSRLTSREPVENFEMTLAVENPPEKPEVAVYEAESGLLGAMMVEFVDPDIEMMKASDISSVDKNGSKTGHSSGGRDDDVHDDNEKAKVPDMKPSTLRSTGGGVSLGKMGRFAPKIMPRKQPVVEPAEQS
ncbi:Transcription factor TFIIIB component B [Nowakowskiella sp. JEL0078]|nr:Transcription factor TFIIIB component B [Nowakowskiella sp. JEL0078]